MSEERAGHLVMRLDTSRHDRDAFSCGEPSLDAYLKTRASQDVKRGAAAVHVMVPGEDATEILAYCTLSAAAVLLDDLPERVRRKLARYPQVSATLIGRLAVAEARQGTGLGGAMLRYALRQSYEASRDVAAALVVVDALDENAARFYAKYGFQPLSEDGRRLFVPMRTVERAIG